MQCRGGLPVFNLECELHRRGIGFAVTQDLLLQLRTAGFSDEMIATPTRTTSSASLNLLRVPTSHAASVL